jgi:small-conductance mechanosensitive channel
VDVVLTRSIGGPIMIWSLMLGIYFATETLDLPERSTRLIEHTLLILTILSLTLMASRLVGNLIRHYGSRVPGATPVTTLTQNLAQLFIILVGILILLRHFGVSITPILTAFGVGGLAVALALQDTLSNLFAGFYVSVAGQVRLGDYIKLNTGEEGYVTDISWRSTTIRALANNMIIIPNAKLAQAVVTNYCLPERRMSLVIPISVSYDSDPDHIERVLLEELEGAAGTIAGLLAEPAPLVRFIPGFGDSALNFSLICQVAEFVDQFLVQHELRKRIWKRFRTERIEMPYPTRTVYLREGEA